MDSDESDPKTLVEMTLRDAPNGTRLDVVESGFDRIPLARRARAFELNEGGWEIQAHLIQAYLEAES